MKVLNNIREIRKERGLSLRDVELLSKVKFSTIGKIERGEMIPSQLLVSQISKGLKLPPCQVFKLDCYFHDVCLMKCEKKVLGSYEFTNSELDSKE